MRFVIVTGMSGAGKSTVLKNLEDMGFFCADNLPIQLVEKFTELAVNDTGSEYVGTALGVDIRSGKEIAGLQQVLDHLNEQKMDYEILFLDASDRVLLKRYKETRRSHPLARTGRIEDGISMERESLAFLRRRADYILDTSTLLTRELRQEIQRIFLGEGSYRNIYITILSFGFKYGIPADADLVFDVRFLPNPFYVDELKHKTGLSQEVRDYVLASPAAGGFLERLEDMTAFLIPNYIKEGKNQLVIAIGCTGGKHRSVTIAECLYASISKKEGYGLKMEHRDIER